MGSNFRQHSAIQMFSVHKHKTSKKKRKQFKTRTFGNGAL